MRHKSDSKTASGEPAAENQAQLPPANLPRPFPEIFDEAICADYIGVKPRTIRVFRSERALPFCRITSKVIRFRKADVDDWLLKQKMAFPPRSRARSVALAGPAPRENCKAAAQKGGSQ